MQRTKGGIHTAQKRKKILKYTKGFKWDRKTKKRAAKVAIKFMPVISVLPRRAARCDAKPLVKKMLESYCKMVLMPVH